MRYEQLRMTRKQKRLTQLQMARLLGLRSRNAYAMKERGERRFSLEEALLLARAMRTSVEGLFFDRSVTETVTKEGGA